MIRVAGALGLALLLSACGGRIGSNPQPPSPDIYAFSLVAPLSVSPSGLVARAVIPEGTTCPSLDVVGADSTPMQQRKPAASTGNAFDGLLVCSAVIPAGAASASIEGINIPAKMPAEVTTTAAVADTGCMITKVVQDCRSPQRWPFAATAAQIAKAQPDLIIHVGDYFYRERACPAQDSDKCGGSPAPPKGAPFLDSAQGWLVDFFQPARTMLTSAPLLAVRGNHEECAVAGNGFFLYLDHRPGTEGICAPRNGKAPEVLSKPWRVDVPAINGSTLRLIVVDSAYGWDYGISEWHERLRPGYRKAARWAKDKGVESWLIVHEPSLGVTSTRYNPGNVRGWTPWVTVDQTVASYGLLSNYAAILSGHVHLSQVVKVQGLPPQFIAGAGGTDLNTAEGMANPAVGALSTRNGEPIAAGLKPYPRASYLWTAVKHSYAIASPNPSRGAWQVQYVRPNGKRLAECTVRAGQPTCE